MAHDTEIDQSCFDAAALIAESDGLLITAGAGMGIDSGLPDFRGKDGFWRAYPALGSLGMSFTQIANPLAFERIPRTAWGFYGHRLQLYRHTQPHRGFALLQEIGKRLDFGARVYTSNVDGQFQKAGFNDALVVECHGTIHHLQCSTTCGQLPWSALQFEPQVDEATCQLLSELPHCPACGEVARPNILMFNDLTWHSESVDDQYMQLREWLDAVPRLVVVEIGAGTAIPSARNFGEARRSPLIRINPNECLRNANNNASFVGIPTGALDALTRISRFLDEI